MPKKGRIINSIERPIFIYLEALDTMAIASK